MGLEAPYEKTASRLGVACAALAGSLGLVAGVSWVTDQWTWTTFGRNHIPMAPGTACLMVLLSSAIALRGQWPGRAIGQRIEAVAAAVAMGLSGWVVANDALGLGPTWESWLSRTSETIGGVPVGRMSPLTALVFAAAAGACLCRLPFWNQRRRLQQAGAVLALGVTLAGLVVVVGYIAGTPLFYGRTIIPMALVTAVGFVFIGMSLLISAGGGGKWRRLLDGRAASGIPNAAEHAGAKLGLVFLALSLGLVVAGVIYLKWQQAVARQRAQSELEAIADLKVTQIVNWRRERLGDARFLAQAAFVRRDVQALLANPSSEQARVEVLEWLTLLKADDRYDQIAIFDPHLIQRLAVVPAANAELLPRELLVPALKPNEVRMSDLHRAETGPGIHLEIVLPIFPPGSRSVAAGPTPIAIMLLRLDPYKFLYPLIQSWPMPSRTAETLLVRREGNEVLYLNELRHRRGTALNLRRPLADSRLPAARAVLGEVGTIEGVDHRGAMVVAALRAVPGTPWFMVAKVDQAEIFAPLRNQALGVGALVGAVLLAAMFRIVLLWRHRQTEFLERELAAERERKALAQRFRALVEQAADAIFVHNGNGEFLEVNQCACASLGYAQEELLKLGVKDIEPDFNLETARAAWSRIEPGRPLTIYGHHRRKDGIRFPVEVRLGCFEADGKRLFLALARDITERERAAEQLRQLNRLLRAIREVNELIIQERDPQRLLTQACELLVRNRGYRLVWIGLIEADSKRVEPIARAGLEADDLDHAVISWNVTETGEGPVGRALRTRQPWVCQNTATDPRFAAWREAARARGYASVAAVPMVQGARLFGALTICADRPEAFDEEELGLLHELAGDLALALRSIEDERERQKATALLYEQAALIDQSQDGILVLAFDGTIRFWNQGAERLFGWTSPEALGRDAKELIVAAESRAKVAETERCVREHGAWDGELTALTKAGRPLLVQARCSVLRDSAGTPLSCLSTLTDITEKKQLEAQFLRAQRLESVGQLAGGVAHDLNNILAPIMMSIEVLQDDVKSPRGHAILETLGKSARRGADIVKQVLTFARGIPGQRILLDPRHLIRDMARIVRETFPKSISVELRLPAELWSVVGDATQLHQILLNLSVNARDAMPAGGRLRLGAENVMLDEMRAQTMPGAKPGPHVMLTVADTGTGVPAEIADKIFDPFFTTKALDKGTGLGLSTVVGIVKGHGGFINFFSQPGQGTQFKVYLPANTQAVAPAPTTDLVSPPRGRGELILVVDDEEAVRAITRSTLEFHGYRTLAASDGAAAIALYVEHGADIGLVLTDLNMPSMDGGAAIAALRQLNPQVKIIVASGIGALPEALVKGDLKVQAVLRKPFDTSALLTAIQEGLQGAAAARG